MSMQRLTQDSFGRARSEQKVDRFTLRNASGIEMEVLTYGATIASVRAPDRTGQTDDVVLGFDDLETYMTRARYFGAVVGRYANRIAKGKFTLDGRTYTLATNNGPNHLHGGLRGWDKAVWEAAPFTQPSAAGVRLTYVSADGEEGYPGTVAAGVTYTLDDANQLRVDYHATSTKPTVVNLTQHAYFNLTGRRADDILGHVLTLEADQFVPVDAGLIPTGELARVDGTPFDFRSPTAIGARIDVAHEQIQRGAGYDHTFVVKRRGQELAHAAHVLDPLSGRTLSVATTEPGVQFYTGNFLDGTLVGRTGQRYGRRAGFCLETQHYPDSPNQPSFPSTVLRPGGDYRSTTVFMFGSEK